MFTCLAMQDSRDPIGSCSAPSHQMVCHAMETLTLLVLRITIYTSVVWPAVGPKSKRASHVLQKVGPSKGIAADLGQPVPQWMIDSVKDRMVSSGHACLADIPKVASCAAASLIGPRRTRPIMFFELFGGQCGTARTLCKSGRKVAVQDRVSVHPSHDICTPSGLMYTFWSIIQMAPGSVLYISAECSTHINMARRHTMRSAEDYWGNDGRLDVREANYIVAALCWLVPFAISLGISIMMENPLGSMFFKVASMSRMLAEYAFKRVVTYHAAFGAKSMKAFEYYVHNIKDDCLRYMVRGKDQAVPRMSASVAAAALTPRWRATSTAAVT